MIEYIIPHNLDDRVVDRCWEELRAGNLISFPSDTSWLVLADPYSKVGVEKLYRLKRELPPKHFSLLVDSISTAQEYAQIGDQAFKLIKKVTPGHFTFILEATKAARKLLKASKTDHEVGLRIAPIDFISKILSKGEHPVLISTNLDPLFDETIYSYLIEDQLGHEIPLILDPGEWEFAGVSTIVSLLDNGIEVIRQGAGEI